jgi:hypothetical protein
MQWVAGSVSLEVKRLEHEANRIKNVPPMHLHDMVLGHRDDFTSFNF